MSASFLMIQSGISDPVIFHWSFCPDHSEGIAVISFVIGIGVVKKIFPLAEIKFPQSPVYFYEDGESYISCNGH